MKLAAKLILIFLFGVLAIVSLFAWQTVKRQRDWEQHRRESHAADLAEVLKPAIEQAYRDGGSVTVRRAIEVSSESLSGPRVRWIDGAESDRQPTRITSRETTSVSVADSDGNRIAYAKVPIQLSENDHGTLEVSELAVEEDQFFWDSIRMSLLSLSGVAALSGLVIFFGGVRLVGRPLERLTKQVNSIGEGKLPQSPVLNSSDELGNLAVAISHMSHRLSEQREAIRRTDRLGTVGTLAAGMAHELGTPLNVISGRAGLISSGKLSTTEVADSAQTIKSEAERMTRIIRELLDFARQAPMQRVTVDLGDVITKTSDLMRTLADKSQVTISTQLPAAPLLTSGDQPQLQQVLTNLISNAIAAMPDGGILSISLEPSSGGQHAIIRVTDTGSGMDEHVQDRIFEPFYTTKDVGQGTGLGLSIAYGIVREHGGDIKVESRPGQGTTFLLSFPVEKRTNRDVPTSDAAQRIETHE